MFSYCSVHNASGAAAVSTATGSGGSMRGVVQLMRTTVRLSDAGLGPLLHTVLHAQRQTVPGRQDGSLHTLRR